MLESPSFDPAQQIAVLRTMFQTIGVLHEAHILNLKVWPRLAFPKAKEVTVNVDVSSNIIEFIINSGRFKMPKDWRKRCKGLHESVQAMLGPEIKTLFIKGGKTIFKGGRLKKPQPPKYEGTDFLAGMIVPQKSWKFKNHNK